MDSHNSDDSPRKPMRRRSHSRNVQKNSVINMAEARREIAHALLLHRSSSSSLASASSTSSSSFVEKELTSNNILGNICNFGIYNNPSAISSQHCYSLMESMPLPEPIWSTTAPSTHAAPTTPMEALEFVWGENQASSYTWWLGFLENLDAKNIENLKCPNVDNIESQHQNGSKLKEAPILSTSDHNSSPDEWLLFPTNEYLSEQL
ncbi:hypothetical protein CFOL_v3_09823 [Cephalotus follicularis]|uniref:Uncharacterized protein n=1 Tax=Cephalotus follicularis TaxID=3775 RepID=A0A1Q3BEU6_CEPFO|nr:hypothetical protein CFOL_v3_09823 [Cephalotus follicularis]